MARREALLGTAYLALGVSAALALASLVDPYASVYDGTGRWIATFLVLGAVASVVIGFLIERWWATSLPIGLAIVTVPLGDLLDQLPFWVFLLACAPFAAGFTGLGVAVGRLGRRSDRSELLVGASCIGLVALAVLTVSTFFVQQTADSQAEARALGYGYPFAFAYSEISVYEPSHLPETFGFDPWENPTTTDDGRFLASFTVVYVMLAGLALGCARLAGRTRGRSSRQQPPA